MSRALDQTKSTVDRIGERLKGGDFSPAVLEALDTFRSSHDRVIPMVLYAVGLWSGGTLTLRTAKSTPSIVAKLRRESIRLSQVQDIAGCRLIVPDIIEQITISEAGFALEEAALEYRDPEKPLTYRIVPRIGIPFGKRVDSAVEPEPSFEKPLFEPVAEDIHYTVKEIDRLTNPQFGYRAIHYVIGYRSRLMEIQVRTQLQHAWAEWSEKAADKYGHELKYGHGNAPVLEKLMRISHDIAAFEDYEYQHYGDDDMAEELAIRRQEILRLIRTETFLI